MSGEAGSGAIFFSGCTLRCVFCQNAEISAGNFGIDVSVARLAQMMFELESQGALNINLVTPGHFAPQVVEAAKAARKAGLTVPILCNTGGYETVESVEAWRGSIDIWLADLKYVSAALSAELSAAPDYFAQARH